VISVSQKHGVLPSDVLAMSSLQFFALLEGMENIAADEELFMRERARAER